MIALARKYRPRRFADLLVQDHVAAALRGAVARDRVGHGYLLTGPRGVGKTTAARILAMALNCERRNRDQPTGEPCGECPSCQRVWSGSANLDVVEIDAASNRSVEDARDLRERAMYAASQEAGYKVYIIDEAHMLTREAWNALLKILEEPPPRVVFVFATTDPQKIAQTAAPVLSRLQRFDFRRIGPAAIRARLQQVLQAEGLEAEDDALAIIGRTADGGMRDALSVLDQCLSLGEGRLTAARVREALGLIDDEAFVEALGFIAGRDSSKVFPFVDRLMASGADLGEFMNGLADLLRWFLMVETGAEPEGLTSAARDAIGGVRGRLNAGDVLRMLNLLAQAETGIRRSSNPRLVVETLLLRWTVMDRTVDLEEVLRGQPADPAPRARAAAAERPGSPPAPAPPRAGPPPAEEPIRRAPPPAGERLTLESVLAAWPDLVQRGKEQSFLLGPILEAAAPVSVDGLDVVVAVKGTDAHLAQGLRSKAGVIEEVLRERFGAGVRLTVSERGLPVPSGSAPPKRMSEKEIRSERLTRIRTTDPALDAAVDALDLEIVDEQ